MNIGNPEEHTILELAQLILNLTGSDSPLVFEPLPENDPVRRRPDITVAGRQLGWKPETGLAEGLARTLGWFRDNVDV